MHLRSLVLNDDHQMLRWMHDSSVVGEMSFDFSKLTISDARNFIRNSWDDTKNIHLAIANDDDEYMGTVSLKNINDNSAEFAIVIKSEAMGRGYAWFGMKSILDLAFNKYGINRVYWCVKKSNHRAIAFYKKHFFRSITDVPFELKMKYEGEDNLFWFTVLKGDDYDIKSEIAGCKLIHIKTIPTLNEGQLSFFESQLDVPFDINRIYYISKVPEGTKRGFHAHKNLKQLLFCPYGKIMLKIENAEGKGEILLSDPSIGVLIDKITWREMTWLENNSVLCVAASDYYNESDYIRSYDEFKTFVEASD